MTKTDQRVHDTYIRLALWYLIKGDTAFMRWTYRFGVTYYLQHGGT